MICLLTISKPDKCDSVDQNPKISKCFIPQNCISSSIKCSLLKYFWPFEVFIWMLSGNAFTYWQQDKKKWSNPPTVKPFRLTYLAKGWEGGCNHSLEVLTIVCLTFCLLLTDRPTPGLPEYKLKVVNICQMHGTGVLKLWCYELFDPFQPYVEIVSKNDEKVL